VSVGMLFFEDQIDLNVSPSIETVLKNAPSNWGPLYIYHAPEARHKAQADWIKKEPYVQLAKNLNREIIWREMDDEYYLMGDNSFALDVEFWKTFSDHHDYLFYFRSDSALCKSPDNPYPIEAFLNFDYIGPAWHGYDYDSLLLITGSGGLSLRNISLMIYCLENSEAKDGRVPFTNEDFYFSYCAQLFGKPAPYDAALKFAIESQDSPFSYGIYGICTRGLHLGCNHAWVNKWLETCPESAFLFPSKDGLCADC